MQISMAILGYSLCSSTLLLANKMAMEHLPLPSVVSFIQIFSSAVIVIVLKLFGVQVDIFSWEALTGYGLYAVAFADCENNAPQCLLK